MFWGKRFDSFNSAFFPGMLLASLVACKNPASNSTGEQELVQKIQALGGQLSMSFGKVVELNLSSKPVTDLDLEELGVFSGLQILNLGDTTITDEGLRHLKQFKRLRELTLSGCPNITGAGLTHLQPLANLYKLQLSGNQQLNNEDMRALWPMRNLGKLDIYKTRVDDDGYNELVRRMPALKGNITH